MFESLEGRQLFAGLTVAGTPGDDNITVRINPNNSRFVQVVINGDESNYSSINSITISGGVGNDTITVWPEILVNTVISGNAGHDTIQGGSAADQITGNAGNDVIYGGKGDDVISGNDGGDYLDGGWGDDTIVGGSGADDLIGGTGQYNNDADAIYQFDGTNADDGFIDDILCTTGSVYYKTSRDTISFY